MTAGQLDWVYPDLPELCYVSASSDPVAFINQFDCMPTASFFRGFGLFVVEGFFDHDLCGRLRAAMRDGIRQAAMLGSNDGTESVDREVRRVTQCKVDDASSAIVKNRLIELKPDLETHFGLTLADCQNPQFLHYATGDFYKPHRDSNPAANDLSIAKPRRISAVVFLNEASVEPRDETYGGGALTFSTLFDDPVGRSLGFPLEADEGLLIAFRSELRHSVALVTHGERYTVAGWYV